MSADWGPQINERRDVLGRLLWREFSTTESRWENSEAVQKYWIDYADDLLDVIGILDLTGGKK